MNKISVILCAFCLLLLGACSGEKTSESIPLSEHPRPDFERAEWINLNGHWAFTFDEAAASKVLAGEGLTAMDQKIMVPFPWGSKLSEVEDKGDIGWYGREVTIPIRLRAFTSVDERGERKIRSRKFRIWAGFSQPGQRSEKLTGNAVLTQLVEL